MTTSYYSITNVYMLMQGRTKQLAKQASAAMLLHVLLDEGVPEAALSRARAKRGR